METKPNQETDPARVPEINDPNVVPEINQPGSPEVFRKVEH